MKRLLPALLLLTFSAINAQNCIKKTIIYGSKTNPLFSSSILSSYGLVNSNPNQDEINASAWTCNSMGFPTCNFRTLIRYDVSEVPENAIVTSARLFLYAKKNNTTGNPGNPTFGTANTSLIQRVTTSWKPGVPSWIAQPGYDRSTQKTLPQSTSMQQDYVADITDFVQMWVVDSSANHGMVVRLKNETFYNSMIFYSGNADSMVQPRLEVTYVLPGDTSYTIYGDKNNPLYSTSGLASFGPDNSNPVQQELVAGAWTCNAMGFPSCDFRTLIRYDVSALPKTSIIHSAKLFLYAKVNAINGNYGNPTFGTANTTLLQKVTEPWTAGVPGWNSQPAVDTTNQKVLPQSSSTKQDYIVDLTDFVQSWVADSSTNDGMMLRLEKETYYNSMIFNSGEAPAYLQPRLEICYSANITLPLHVTRFEGSNYDSKNLLTWTTSNELDMKEIVLEKSEDGRSFKTIASFTTLGRSDNTYRYEDLEVRSDKAFYRLKISGKDGSITYSKTIILNGETKMAFNVFPNPASDFIQLSFTSEKAQSGTIKIATAEGKVVRVVKSNIRRGSNSLIIEGLSRLSKGTYFVLIDVNQQVSARRIILQ